MNLPTDQASSSVLAFEAEKPFIYHVYPSKQEYLGHPLKAWIPDSSIQDMNLPTDQAWSSVLAFEAEKPSIYHVYIIFFISLIWWNGKKSSSRAGSNQPPSTVSPPAHLASPFFQNERRKISESLWKIHKRKLLNLGLNITRTGRVAPLLSVRYGPLAQAKQSIHDG